MLSNNEKYGGWCIMSKLKIAEELDLSERTIHNAIVTLEAKGLVKKNEKGFLRTTDEWNELLANKHDYMIAFKGKEQQFISGNLQQKAENISPTAKIADTLQNLPTGVQKLQTDPAKIADNIYSNNNIDISSKEETRYGEFKNIKLKEGEREKLVERFGEPSVKERIENLSTYIASTGRKYSSHYATILAWARKEPQLTAKPKKIPPVTQFEDVPPTLNPELRKKMDEIIKNKTW